jgi:hypothetical protein
MSAERLCTTMEGKRRVATLRRPPHSNDTGNSWPRLNVLRRARATGCNFKSD